uniref:SURF1-like protein n=1 Tax=Syphacia muris TaxID=451379 RepID=A0A0N5AEH0_9BILA
MPLLCVRNRIMACLSLRSFNLPKSLCVDKKSAARRRYEDADYQKSLLQLVEEHKFDDKEEQKRFRWSWSAAVLLVPPAITFWLGYWQVRRLKWKEGILSDIHARMQLPTIELNLQNLNSFPDLAYRSVKVTGNFVNGKQLIVNMKRKKDDKGNFRDLVKARSSGYFVITPFRLKDSGKVIMVNRGWIESECLRNLSNLRVDGEKTFEAIVPPVQKKRWLVTVQDENTEEVKSNWLLTDLNEMADLLSSEPVLVDAFKGLTSRGQPLVGQTSYIPRNNHLSYIITCSA